jgi:hypothetical protein
MLDLLEVLALNSTPIQSSIEADWTSDNMEPEDLPAKTTRGTQGLILVLDFITVIEISWLDFPHASQITVLQVDHTVNQGNLGGTILRAQFDVIANDSE